MTNFFHEVPHIVMHDQLALTLGSSHDGHLRYSYADVVKLTGHSCPTVAGAYIMTTRALRELYDSILPVRGDIMVTIKGRLGDGVVGVVASVATFITGATDISGFHGLNGRYDRRQLLHFDENLSVDMMFKRVDNGVTIGVSYNPSFIKPDPDMPILMEKVISNTANKLEKKRFALLWQDRVKRILLCDSDAEKIISIYRQVS